MEVKKDYRKKPGLKKDIENNSGQGAGIKVPNIVAKKFNWGAFCLTLLWALANKSFKPFGIYILVFIVMLFLVSVLESIPIAQLIISIFIFLYSIWVAFYYGINGNKWAWQNKKWTGVKQFHMVQRRWAVASVIFIILSLSVYISIFMSISKYANNSIENVKNSSESKMMLYKAQMGLTLAYEIEHRGLNSCDSESLANYFHAGLPDSVVNGNVVSMRDMQLTFQGDGYCSSSPGHCFVKVKSTTSDNNIILRIVVNNNSSGEKIPVIYQEDANKYN